MEESNESNVLASYSSFNVTPSGAIELRDVGAEKNDVKKEWRSYWVDDTSVDHCSMCEKHFRVRTRKVGCRCEERCILTSIISTTVGYVEECSAAIVRRTKLLFIV